MGLPFFGRYAQAIQPMLAQHPQQSGVRPLIDAREAFAARMLLARNAQYSLDLQYYIWRNDRTGTLLFEALHEAADRGVKVRLLLDDHSTGGLDAVLIALQSHPNIDVRLYNPLKLRRPRWINYLYDFARLNRRMHNKLFIADQQVLISGGRNIGDEYFGAHDGVVFSDLDVLLIGPIVEETQADFERYWNAPSAVPLNRLLTLTKPITLSALEERAKMIERDPGTKRFVEALQEHPFVQDFLQRKLEFEWAEVNLLSDDPRKTLGLAKQHHLLAFQLQQAIGNQGEIVNVF